MSDKNIDLKELMDEIAAQIRRDFSKNSTKEELYEIRRRLTNRLSELRPASRLNIYDRQIWNYYNKLVQRVEDAYIEGINDITSALSTD